MNTNAIETRQFLRRQGRFQLGPLDWIVPTGSIYALVGPNGAGKSTLLDLLMGMGRAHGGTAKLFGLDLEPDEVAIKRRVAYVSPELNYNLWGRVGRAIDFVAGFYPDWDMAKCQRLEEAFQLDRDAKISSLSFGAKTKLSLVIALSRDADLFLLDEPTTGLDVLGKNILFTELLAVMKSDQKTVVISSHNLNDLERFADHIGIMNEGKLLLSGRMDEVVQRYQEVDIEWPGSGPCPIPGARVLSRAGSRARLLVEQTDTSGSLAIPTGVHVIGQSPVTLEQLFVDLVQPPSTPNPTGRSVSSSD